MPNSIEMVYSACNIWLKDWLEAETPFLHDEWDLTNWMEYEMKEAVNTFLTFGFKTSKARSDALVILRCLFYEYFLFQQELAKSKLIQNEAVTIRLPKCIQTTQKSSSWHNESREILSGHEFGPVCVGSKSERFSVMQKKCANEITAIEGMDHVESRTVFLTSDEGKLSAFKWGWRYEPVARQVYEKYISGLDSQSCEVYDQLGRIRHSVLPRLGASPDGLVMTGSRQGRLLEIKCPSTRELDYKVPIHYYCQMQLQAEVCDVDAVEYIEVKFAAISQEQATEAILSKGTKPWIGKVCVCAKTPDTPPTDYTYEYSPIYDNTIAGYQQCIDWKPDGIIHESSVWYINDFFHKTVLRNRRWWDAVGYPSYMDFWKDVEMARKDGRYKPKALFLDSASETSLDKLDTGPLSYNTAVASDGTASGDMHDGNERPVVGWLGVESNEY